MSHTPPSVPTAAAQTADELLDAAEVARRLKLSRTTVYRLARAGEMRSHRFGKGTLRPRGLRFPESAVTEYLRATTSTPEEFAS